MVVIMLLHGILGCCWHHGHGSACAAECSPVAHRHSERTSGKRASGEHRHVCGHHHGHGADESTADEPSGAPKPGPAPHDDGQCHDQVCVYVGSKAPELSQPVLFLAQWASVVLAMPTAASPAERNLTAEAPPPFGSASETCALLQVWRI